MDDRLNELQSSSGCRSKSVFSDRESVTETLQSMVLSKNNELKTSLDELEHYTKDVDRMTKQVVVSTSMKVEQELSAKILDASKEAKLRIGTVKNILDTLREEQNELTPNNPPAEKQMLHNIISSNSRRFKTLLQDYMRSQEHYKVEVQRKTQRQLKIAYPDANEEALRQLAENTEGARKAVQKQMQTGGTQNLDNVLRDIDEKYKNMKELESNVSELHDLFIYLGTLVDNQQDAIDSIEASVWSTEEYTTKAQKHLLIAKENQQKYENKKMCFYILLGCIILGVVGYLVYTLGGGPSSNPVPIRTTTKDEDVVSSAEQKFRVNFCTCDGGLNGVMAENGCNCTVFLQTANGLKHNLKGSSAKLLLQTD